MPLKMNSCRVLDLSNNGDFARMSLIRLLIVDDVEFWRPVYSKLESDPSFLIVFQASDGLKAVEAAERVQPTVVLLDIGLPGLNGLEAGGWIRRVAPAAKIVFVTMENDPDIVEAARQLGAWGYVLKSDADRELVAAIHSVVRGDKYLSRSLAGHRFLDGPKLV
jgi:DNA-binding NarL/FixJ family response regulator